MIKVKPVHVYITSYLGDTKAKRTLRLDYHLRQREVLRTVWKDLRVVSLISGYDSKAITALQDHKYEFYNYGGEKVSKWKKHNDVFRKLHDPDLKNLRCVLLLDDDVIPRPVKEDDVKNGLIDCAKLIRHLCWNPDQMPAPVAYFGCSGLRYDAYYRAAAPVGEAPTAVVGWAMMVRSDCGVMYSKRLVTDKKTGLVSVDTPFRIKCKAKGIPVVKYSRAFFKTFQNIKDEDNTSVWVGSHEERQAAVQAHRTRLRKMYPEAFARGKKKQTGVGKGFGIGP